MHWRRNRSKRAIARLVCVEFATEPARDLHAAGAPAIGNPGDRELFAYALLERDQRAAQGVVASRDAILELTAELRRLQASRLAQDDRNRLFKHRVQLEILGKLRRIYSVAEHMVLSVLPRGVLAGELTV